MCREPVTTPDLYPTIFGAADTPLPADQTVDGTDLGPLLAGERDALDRDAIFWHFPHYGNQGGTPYGAVRAGDWKLIEFYEDDHVELYDLSNDVREERDPSDEHPKRAGALHERLDDWRDDVGAKLPDPNPDFES